MRKIIYNAIAQKLKSTPLGIQTIGLWNNNVEQLPPEKEILCPAVFIEFKPISWNQLGAGIRTADLRVNLHIVTESPVSNVSTIFPDTTPEHLDIVENISKAIQGLSGENFNGFTLVESVTDHKHQQLQDDQECYITRLTDTSGSKLQTMITELELVQGK